MSASFETASEVANLLELRDPRALPRAISWVEAGDPRAEELLARLPAAVNGCRIGITGSAGVGKSTLAGKLVAAFRARGERVAVIAVDPTSPVSGGALLGDRLRMRGFENDPDVYIRSLASRAGVGGISGELPETLELIECARFGVILVETIGTGQLDTAISQWCDFVLLILTPESGDGIQLLKGGAVEVAHQWVINKSDRPGAELLLSAALEQAEESGKPAPLLVSALNGTGVDLLAEKLMERVNETRMGDHPKTRMLHFRTQRLRQLAEREWTRECWSRVGGEARLNAAGAELSQGKKKRGEILKELLQEVFSTTKVKK